MQKPHLLLVTGLVLGGCTTVRVHKVEPGKAIDGFAYSLPRTVIVLKQNAEGKIVEEITHVADETHTYAVNVNNYFSTDTLDVVLTESGFLKSIEVKPDGTAVAEAVVDVASKSGAAYLADRAAERAAKRKQVTDDISKLTNQKTSLKTDLDNAKSQISTLESEIDQLDYELSKLESEPTLRKRLDAAKTKAVGLKEAIKAETDETKKKALEADLKEVEDEITATASSLDTVRDKRREIGLKKDALAVQVGLRAKYQSKLDDVNARLDELEDERDSWDVDPDPASNKVAAAGAAGAGGNVGGATPGAAAAGAATASVIPPRLYEIRVDRKNGKAEVAFVKVLGQEGTYTAPVLSVSRANAVLPGSLVAELSPDRKSVSVQTDIEQVRGYRWRQGANPLHSAAAEAISTGVGDARRLVVSAPNAFDENKELTLSLELPNGDVKKLVGKLKKP